MRSRHWMVLRTAEGPSLGIHIMLSGAGLDAILSQPGARVKGALYCFVGAAVGT
jgi:hypothetical protein